MQVGSPVGVMALDQDSNEWYGQQPLKLGMGYRPCELISPDVQVILHSCRAFEWLKSVGMTSLQIVFACCSMILHWSAVYGIGVIVCHVHDATCCGVDKPRMCS